MKHTSLRWLGLAVFFAPVLLACSKPAEPMVASASVSSAPGASATPSPALTDLRVAIDPTYEPFTYKGADGKATGFDVDFASALCVQIQRKCVFEEQVWDSMSPGLMARKYDVIISSMGITKERQVQMAFSDRYYKTYSRMVLKKAVNFDGPASIKGQRIGVV